MHTSRRQSYTTRCPKNCTYRSPFLQQHHPLLLSWAGRENLLAKSSVFFCKVSVPMELRLTVQKAGSTRGEGPETQGQWQQLRKVIRKAHRPVVFEVGGLIPDTRYETRPSKRRSPRMSGTLPHSHAHNEIKLACASQRNPDTVAIEPNPLNIMYHCYHRIPLRSIWSVF